MTKEQALKLIDIYGEAWEKQDPDLICTIFTEDATYDDPHEEKNIGREAIRSYWVSKVVEEQKDIHFKVLNVWTDEGVVIVEWDAKFVNVKNNMNYNVIGTIIFTVEGDKFSSLREYYKTVKVAI